MVDADLAGHVQGRRSELDRAGGITEAHRQVARRLLDAAELVDEIHMPGSAAEFAVGADCRPTSSCMATTSVMHSCSMARSRAASISPATYDCRALSSRCGRSRLPT